MGSIGLTTREPLKNTYLVTCFKLKDGKSSTSKIHKKSFSYSVNSLMMKIEAKVLILLLFFVPALFANENFSYFIYEKFLPFSNGKIFAILFYKWQNPFQVCTSCIKKLVLNFVVFSQSFSLQCYAAKDSIWGISN